MTFVDQHLLILVALRSLAPRLYLELMHRLHADQAGLEQSRSQVGQRSQELATTEGDVGLPNLTPLLSLPDYREFLHRVSQVTPDYAPVIQNVLETKEYEQRLTRLKSLSVQDYLGELRVVSPQEVVDALVKGTIVNSTDESGDPSPIRSDEAYSAAFADVPTATAYLEASVLSSVLARFASHSGDQVADPQGLRLNRVVIGGELNLNWLKLDFPLGFEGCDFDHWVSASHMTVPWLSFDSCDFTPYGHAMRSDGALNAEFIHVETTLRFWGCRGLGQLFVPHASIGEFSPANPDVAAAELPTVFRTVIDNATFGTLVIPEHEGAIPFDVDESVRVGSLVFAGSPANGRVADSAIARRLHGWLTQGSNRSEDVWSEFERALRHCGRSGAAREFAILGAEERTRSSRLGWLTRITLGPTVRYFHDTLRAIWWVAGLIGIAFVAAFAFAGNFAQSPLSNPSMLPASWFDLFGERFAWSLLYAVDTVVSPLSLGQADAVWPESAALTVLFATLKGLGLLLIALFVIGVTGLAERRGGNR
ncbi:hypothetical protein [Nocardioides sp.]|uniref:hypothetical protein n=1 Tax=Nocardioides sp. TaxID=35761 RepID=UPI002B26F005|nr:hypothetical protein [Nocardioides sp.]